MNKEKIWLMTGDCAPFEGSTCEAKANPEVAAIFSPAKITVEKQMFNIMPHVKPSAIS
jgi:hypothetical protein